MSIASLKTLKNILSGTILFFIKSMQHVCDYAPIGEIAERPILKWIAAT